RSGPASKAYVDVTRPVYEPSTGAAPPRVCGGPCPGSRGVRGGTAAVRSRSAPQRHPQHVGGLRDVLGGVVEDAHQAGTARDRRIPLLVDHVREVLLRERPEMVLEGGERGVDVLQQARTVLDHDAARLRRGVAVA